MNDDNACLSCRMFDELVRLKNIFLERIFEALPVTEALVSFVVLYFVLIGAFAMARPQEIGERFTRIWKTVFMLPFVLALLTPLSRTGDFLNFYTDRTPPAIPVAVAYIFNPMEQLAADVGGAVLSVVAQINPEINRDQRSYTPSRAEDTAMVGADTYAALLTRIEAGIGGILMTVGKLVSSVSIFNMNVDRLFIAILIVLPYLFVFAIFCAFLVEAIFKFVSAAILAPIVIPGFLFPVTRPFAIATLRVLLGAMLTVIFASGAMGFTLVISHTYGHALAESIATDTELRANIDFYCSASIGGVDDGGASANPNCQDARDALANRGSPVWNFGTMMLIITGWLSILLHLNSKTIASNISGANDGAGPAAATVAAGKMAVGGAAMLAGRTAFGQGGIGASLQDFARGTPASTNPLRGAISGGALGVAQSIMAASVGGGHTDGGSAAGGRGGGQAVPGGGGRAGMGGGGDPQMAVVMGNVAKSLDQLNKTLGGGERNRS